MNTIGTRIKALRLQKKITQPELAELIGVAKSMISQWETLKNEPKACYIYSLATNLNVSADYLLGIENEDFTPSVTNTTLPADEERLLQEYRKLDKPIKKMCYYYVEHMVTATKEDKEINNHG